MNYLNRLQINLAFSTPPPDKIAMLGEYHRKSYIFPEIGIPLTSPEEAIDALRAEKLKPYAIVLARKQLEFMDWPILMEDVMTRFDGAIVKLGPEANPDPEQLINLSETWPQIVWLGSDKLLPKGIRAYRTLSFPVENDGGGTYPPCLIMVGWNADYWEHYLKTSALAFGAYFITNHYMEALEILYRLHSAESGLIVTHQTSARDEHFNIIPGLQPVIPGKYILLDSREQNDSLFARIQFGAIQVWVVVKDRFHGTYGIIQK